MKERPGILPSVLTALLSVCALGSGQIVENPAKPMATNAGRIVTLKEELRIEDTGAGYFFKNPGPIRVSPRGDIFFKDGPEQALQFDPEGRFVRNLFKKVKAPGNYPLSATRGLPPTGCTLEAIRRRSLSLTMKGTWSRNCLSAAISSVAGSSWLIRRTFSCMGWAGPILPAARVL